tara:strand:- start:733 stop:969 length:237 start_codon:yes stop_codon:yes gene_type:complete
MFYQLFFITNIKLILGNSILLDMTINNPIFIFSLITVIWFIPGILVRRLNELKQIKRKEKTQTDAIKKLYPKQNKFKD